MEISIKELNYNVFSQWMKDLNIGFQLIKVLDNIAVVDDVSPYLISVDYDHRIEDIYHRTPEDFMMEEPYLNYSIEQVNQFYLIISRMVYLKESGKDLDDLSYLAYIKAHDVRLKHYKSEEMPEGSYFHQFHVDVIKVEGRDIDLLIYQDYSSSMTFTIDYMYEGEVIHKKTIYYSYPMALELEKLLSGDYIFLFRKTILGQIKFKSIIDQSKSNVNKKTNELFKYI